MSISLDRDRVEDRETIADLEIYGLSLRAINFLENSFGFLYVDELRRLRDDDVLAIRGAGIEMVKDIRRALARAEAGRPVKTVAECMPRPDEEE